ncbi:hsp90 co-chaperone Cdc37 [Podochytrium sp. JEL0797]|nr:hsp90 co-chaperone Cdc37 [Podochytrium sp. JEL0797]
MSQGFSYSKVDKASMVRWKQAEVHRVRRERHDKIDALEAETQMNNNIVKKLESLTKDNCKEVCAEFSSWDKTLAHDVMVKAHQERDARWQPPVADPFFMKRVDINAMVDKLTKNAGDNAQLSTTADAFVKTLHKRNEDIAKEIKKEQAAIDAKISSETVKEGFSKSIITKQAPPAPAPAPKKKTVKSTETEIVTLNSPAADGSKQAAASAEPVTEEDDSEIYITDPNVDIFSKLTTPESSYKFISSNAWILSEVYSDQILAEAFNHGMKGDFKRCQQCVHQSLLLQYCKLLGKDGVMLFFQRLTQPGHKAKDAFLQDVLGTYQRIVERVKVLKTQERDEEEKEKREGEARANAALQPDGTYKLPVTAESTEEDVKRAEVFDQLPVALQRALLTQDVDEINGFLGASSKEDTEKYIGLATSVGLISLTGGEDEEEEGDAAARVELTDEERAASAPLF